MSTNFLEYRNNPSYTNICIFNQKELHIYIIIKKCSSKSCRKIQKFTTARNSNKQRLRVNIHNNAEIRRNSNKYGNDKLTLLERHGVSVAAEQGMINYSQQRPYV